MLSLAPDSLVGATPLLACPTKPKDSDCQRGKRVQARIRAVATLALAAVAVAILMTMPAFAAKGGTEHPYKASGTGYGTYTYKQGPPEVFTFDVDGPFIGSPLGKGTVRTYSDASGNNERSVYTLANGDKLYGTGLQDELSTKGIVCPFPWDAFSETFTFKGGTGRFKNATGKGVTRGCFYILDKKTWIVTYTDKGTITY